MSGFDGSAGSWSGVTSGVAADVIVKATALLGLAYLVHAGLGRRRALARSALWNGCLAGLILLPVAGAAFPRLRVAIPWARAADSPLPRIAASAGGPAVEGPGSAEPGLSREARGSSEVEARSAGGERVPTPRSGTGAIPASRWGWTTLGLVVYLAGAALLIARLVGALAAVWALLAGSEVVADPRWNEALNRWRGRLGVVRRVPLRGSSRVSVPIALGWWRPSIVVPWGLVETAEAGVIDAVLLHELGHIKRGDYAWNLARKLVEIGYWPHPLVWPIARVVGPVREQACDDLCVHAFGGPGGYAASLLAVASGLVRRPEASLGLAMARPSNLARRLAWIARTAGAPRCLLRWPARLALVGGVAILAGVLGSIELARAATKIPEPAAPAKAELPASEDGGDGPASVVVTVKEAGTGRALAGARIQASIDQGTIDLVTDASGRARIDRAGRVFDETLTLDIWDSDHVQQRIQFAQKGRRPRIPAEFTAELYPGEETLGGKVVDEAGRPIEGVGVKIWGYLGSKKDKRELAFMVDARTDARGDWRCRSFRGMTFAFLYLSHPDYLADHPINARKHGRPTPSDPAQPDERPMAVLRDFSDVQTLTKGEAVEGVVVDDRGDPVAGAEVGWLTERNPDTFHHLLPVTSTGTDGKFRFGHVPGGRLMLQGRSPGHAPGLIRVEEGRRGEPAKIKLGAPRAFIGRVLDSKGAGIAGATVNIDTWRGSRALGAFFKADADGRFRWLDAPSDAFLVGVTCPGFRGIIQQRVVPGDFEIPFTLKRSLSILGSITDAATKKRVERPTVELGRVDPKTGAVSWGEDNRVFAMQGTLQANVDAEVAPEFQLRVRAKGYETQVSRTFRADEGEVEYDLALKPADRPQGVVLKGVVRRLDGSPLAGADVAVAYPGMGRRRDLQGVSISNGKIGANPDLATAKTGPVGEFAVGREPDPEGRYFAVVVVHPDGFAEVDRASFEADSNIVLRPWARIEGVVTIGGRPAPGATVGYFGDRLGNPDVPSVDDRGEVPTDADGRFALFQVVPGDIRVAPRSLEAGRPRAWSNGTLVRLKPGEAARVEFGTAGRPVVARIARPDGFDPKADYLAGSEFEIESDRRNIP